MDSLKPWQRAIAALAVAKVVFAVALILAAATRTAETTPRDLLMLLNVAVFGSAAAFLLTLGRQRSSSQRARSRVPADGCGLRR